MPEVERFMQIAFGWLVDERARLANELAALTMPLARLGRWYAAEPRFRVARGLAPRSLAAEDLSAVAAGPLPLTMQEIEQALNRRASQRIDLRSVQSLMRNASEPGQLAQSLLELCAPAGEPEARALLALLGELWNTTPRYELRGRTPDEVRAERGHGIGASSA